MIFLEIARSDLFEIKVPFSPVPVDWADYSSHIFLRDGADFSQFFYQRCLLCGAWSLSSSISVLRGFAVCVRKWCFEFYLSDGALYVILLGTVPKS